MLDDSISQEAGYLSASNSATGTEMGDQRQPELKRAGHPAGYFKMICW